MTDVQAISIGYAINFDTARAGAVHSVFARAANLLIGREMWTLVVEDQADLPLGVRLAAPKLTSLGLRRGDPVNVRAGFLGLRSRPSIIAIDCRTVPRWVPCHQPRLEPGLTARLSVLEVVARDRAWSGSAAMASTATTAADQHDTHSNVLVSVVGRGPGATPAGDDVLIGILAVLQSACSGIAGTIAAARLARLIVPLLPTTTDISAHLLRQAMNGLFGRSLHDLLLALTGNPPPPRLTDLVRRVVETGATSGADTCMGVIAAASSFLVPRDQRIAA